MVLKKQVKKLQHEGKREFAKVKKKIIKTIVGDPTLMEAFLKRIADSDQLTENFLASVMRNEKLYGMLRQSIESGLTPLQPTFSSGQTAPTKKPKYIGPKDSDFPNAHAIQAYWQKQGFVPEMAGRLADGRWTPHKIFLLEDLETIRNQVRRVGNVTINRLAENKKNNTQFD